MQKLLGLVFAALLAAELALLVVVLGVIAMFPFLLWQRNPLSAFLAVLGSAVVAFALWRSYRADTAAASGPPVHPGISLSRIPIAGVPGALYMLQFAVWVLVTPEVGLLYAALIAGGLLLVPLIAYANRPGRGSVPAASTGAVLGALSGLAVVAFVSVREVPLAFLFMVALAAGVLGAPIVIWLRGRQRGVSIAPYSQ